MRFTDIVVYFLLGVSIASVVGDSMRNDNIDMLDERLTALEDASEHHITLGSDD